MKKIVAIVAVLVVLGASACSRRSSCPAYGSLTKPQSAVEKAV